MSRQASFDRYMSSGSRNYGTDPAVLVERIRRSFPQPIEPPRATAPAIPNQETRWANYWRNYRAPASSYTRPVVQDTRSPAQKLIDAAQNGDTNAMWNLAVYYFRGVNGWEKNPQAGVYWLKTAFERGRADAATRLFYYFDPAWNLGDGDVKKDAIQALYWLQKGAKGGDPEAMTLLGQRTLEGAGVDVDAVEGLRLLKAALQGGDIKALIWLKWAYEYGRGVPKDLLEATRWQREKLKRGMTDVKPELIRLLVETDDAQNRRNTAEIVTLLESEPENQELQILHASLIDTGVLGPPDPVKCVALCQTIIAKNQVAGAGVYFIAEAKLLLADHLYEGNGVRKDELAAYALYRAAFAAPGVKSTKSGFYYASLLGGRLKTIKADGSAVAIEEPKTALPLLVAAERDEALPKTLRAEAALLAARALASDPSLTNGTPVSAIENYLYQAQQYDPERTIGIAFGVRLGWFEPFQKSNAAGILVQAPASVKAGGAVTFWLAVWHFEDTAGKGRDWERPIDYVLQLKNWDAHLWLSDQLLSGKYIPRDTVRAEELLRAAATEGQNAQAQNNLGVALWRGSLGEKRVAEGLTWMEQALGNGFWVAGRNLAKIHHLGLDVPKDETRAIGFLEKAGEVGGAEAVQLVADSYEKGEIIGLDPKAAARWRAVAAK